MRPTGNKVPMRLTPLLLTLALAGSLVGCGDGDADPAASRAVLRRVAHRERADRVGHRGA